MLLQELQIGLRSVGRREDLVFGGHVEGGRLYVCEWMSVSFFLSNTNWAPFAPSCGVQSVHSAVLRSSHTFTYTLLCAHLRAIFHCVQSEVDLGDLLLVLHGAERIVNVLILGGLTVHRGGGRLFLVRS